MDNFWQQIPSNHYNFSQQPRKLNSITDLQFPRRVDIKQLPYYYTLNKLYAWDGLMKQFYEIPRNYGHGTFEYTLGGDRA